MRSKPECRIPMVREKMSDENTSERRLCEERMASLHLRLTEGLCPEKSSKLCSDNFQAMSRILRPNLCAELLTSLVQVLVA